MPQNPDDHQASHKFPFVAAEILSKNATVGRALINGGRKAVEDNKNLVVEELDLNNNGDEVKPKKSGYSQVKIKFGQKKKQDLSAFDDMQDHETE